MLDHQPRACRQDCLRIRGIGHRFADGIEDRQASVEINGLGGLGDGVDHADDIAVGITNRAIAKSEERLLRAFAAFDLQSKVFDVGGLAGVRGLSNRADLVPGFLPDVAERASQRVRLVAENRYEGVVIECDELRAPDDRLREMRGETERDSGLEYIGPVFQRAEGRIRPVVTADLPGHLAVVLQPVCHGVRVFPGHLSENKDLRTGCLVSAHQTLFALRIILTYIMAAKNSGGEKSVFSPPVLSSDRERLLRPRRSGNQCRSAPCCSGSWSMSARPPGQ